MGNYRMSEQNSDSSMPRKPRGWAGFSCILGMIAAYASVLTAKGNGWSPLVFLGMGLLGTPFLAIMIRSRIRRWPWTALGLAIVLICATCYWIAGYSTQIGATEALIKVFETSPPAGLTVLEARQQWYDGINYVITFQSNRIGIDALLSQRKYDDQSNSTEEHHKMQLRIPFLDTSELIPETYTGTRLWVHYVEGSAGRWILISWDEETGRGVAKGFDD